MLVAEKFFELSRSIMHEIVYDLHVMSAASSPLISQIESIKTTLSTMLEADRKDEALDLFVSLLTQFASDHDKLAHQLRLMIKERFGRKTERIDPAQLALFLEELGKSKPMDDEARPVVAYVRRKPIERKGSKAMIPDSIPRKVVRVEPDEADKTCGCGASKVCIGCERSQVLDLIPAQFEVIVYERAKYACKACEGEGVVVAPVPAKPIDGGLPGFGLMADVLIKKYAEHLPLHRIREISNATGPTFRCRPWPIGLRPDRNPRSRSRRKFDDACWRAGSSRWTLRR